MENPRDTQKLGWAVKAYSWFYWTLLTLIVFLGMITVYSSVARAHGYAEWFMQDRYKSRYGVHCCGPNDCKYLEEHQATVTKMDDGYLVITKDYGSHFFRRQGNEDTKGGNAGGLYFTQDPDNRYVLCIYQGKIVCLAVPREGDI